MQTCHEPPKAGRPSVLIHCQYVYGIGHFVRAVELARSLLESFDVHLVTGGEPVPRFAIPDGLTLTQLPAIFKDEASGRLQAVAPGPGLDACLAQRVQVLADFVRARPPDIVITEHFPFGLLFEREVVHLFGLVRASAPGALIVSSVRDVIDSAQGGASDQYILALIERWFDLVLVHGDERVIPLRASFPLIERCRVPCHHTGYVVEPPPVATGRAGKPLLVGAIGGGRLGRELLTALVAAHRHAGPDCAHELLLFRGAFDHESDGALAEAGVRVERFDRARYRAALAQAAGVICLGGYNSVLEALSMSLPVLVYKRRFLGANQEQALRAELFGQSGLVATLEENELAAPVLAGRMQAHFARPRAGAPAIRFDGARQAHRILLAHWQAHRASAP